MRSEGGDLSTAMSEADEIVRSDAYKEDDIGG